MMQERRPATTIAELDLHLGYIMEELRDMRMRYETMMRELATKAEVAEHVRLLEEKIVANSPRTLGHMITQLAIGISAVAAAVIVIINIVRYLPK